MKSENTALKASEKAENEDKNDCHKDYKRHLRRENAGKRTEKRTKRFWIEQNKVCDNVCTKPIAYSIII